jgi:sugar lactone lactonase YvrE
VAVLADRPGMRFNDGRCDPRGRAFAGTMAYDQADPGARDAAALYRLDTVVRLPVTQVTSCCFGGRAGDRLYVTSARGGLGPEQLAAQPLAGAVFVADPGATGPAATPLRRV